ncbi:TetR/AcrR family transcriptional regulator, partial [Blastomonas sp.]|uniref:TetR/AcrR family transcriptional regulator n=1 Tax=Blastomonas sp. TaxID=1909299 RepID=UPI00359406F0
MHSALHTFLERGFNAATIEQIAARAGVSKVTIYNRFTDKETLFEAVIKEQTEQIAEATMSEAALKGDFEAQLNAFGHGLLTFLFASDHVALDRMLPQEIAHLPDMAHRFFDAGPGQSRTQLAALLERGRAIGWIDFDNAIDAAEDLMALWKGFADVELKFGVRHGMSGADINRRLKRGTAVFLR